MQNLVDLGLQKIAIDVQKALEPICLYLFRNYGIEVKSISVDKWHEQLPNKIAEPQGYVIFKIEETKK